MIIWEGTSRLNRVMLGLDRGIIGRTIAPVAVAVGVDPSLVF